jgi:cell division protein FtsB
MSEAEEHRVSDTDRRHEQESRRRREWRRTMAVIGAVGLGFLFLTGFLPAQRDVRMLDEAETQLRSEILMLQQVNLRLRSEINAARFDPDYAEALARARGAGRIDGETAVRAAGWRVPTTQGER